ncbi:MAG: error-prone DNA polymerase [Gammaproteobacteria bacterium]
MVGGQDESMPRYAELHTISNFTFLRGASHPEELVARAKALGYSALAITDECSLAGIVRAHVAAREHKLKLIVGSELRLADGLRLVLLAADGEGYGNLCELITRARRAAAKGGYRLTRSDLDAGVPGCLALWLPDAALDATALHWLAERFPAGTWIVVELLRGPDDGARLQALVRLGEDARLPLVAAGDVHMHVRSRRMLQDTLVAIRLGVPVAQAGYALYPNGERHLHPRDELAARYSPALLRETVEVADRCSFSLDSLTYEYPEELVPAGETAIGWLRRLTAEGMALRWPQGSSRKVRDLIEHELEVIEALGYERYFLTVQDLVRFARERGILCQGRGSAANSAVCYCLGITEVDPLRMDVLFERFVSRERNEPPDIDVDFEHQRREEVIQYIYGKYGRERAALAASVVCYRPRSAIRDVGKALGLASLQVDRLAKSIAWWDGRRVLPERFQEAGLDPQSPVIRRLGVLVNTLVGFPRHLSQHVGGFVIAQGRLSRLVPIENAAMAARTVLQWDKTDLEALGFLKVDVLGLGMLSAIRRALDLIAEYRGKPLTMADIPAEDPKVYTMIQRADTIGVFQIESRAQMAMLPRLKPKTFYDLVIEVAIVRPGPIQGGMVHPYLRRRQGREAVVYPSEAVRAVLARTLGVPIFQEQVMRLAVVVAGFSPGEADQLRRAMAAWHAKGGLGPFQQRLYAGMQARGYSAQFARQLFHQIQGFAEYGFPESHAASFALLVYVSAWLKCHHPAAFSCALLNSQPMGFYAAAQLIQDAKQHGVEVRPVDVRRSLWDCVLEPDRQGGMAIRLGLRLIQGLGQTVAEQIVAGRSRGAYHGVEDLAGRAQLGRGELAKLAAAGALEALAGHRHQAFWQVAAVEPRLLLWEAMDISEPMPVLAAPSEGEDVVADYVSLGFTLGRHPLALVRHHLNGVCRAEEVGDLGQGTTVRVAGLVICRQCPATARGIVFLSLEDETGFINIVVKPQVGQCYRRALLGARLLEVVGVIQRETEVVHVVAGQLIDQSDLIGRLPLCSRDFH